MQTMSSNRFETALGGIWRMVIIYCITNKVNGKRYVGQTKYSLECRWRRHVANAAARKKCRALEAAIRKYGPEAFVREIIDALSTRAGANLAERLWIERRNTISPNGYNLDSGGTVAKLMHIESKQAISDSIRRVHADRGADLRKEISVKAAKTYLARYTAKERSAMCSKGRALGKKPSLEQLSASGKKAGAALWTGMTLEKLEARRIKTRETLWAKMVGRALLEEDEQ